MYIIILELELIICPSVCISTRIRQTQIGIDQLIDVVIYK